MGRSADPTKTSVHDHSTHPQAGSGFPKESRSFDPKVGAQGDRKLEGAMGGGGDGPDPAAASDLDADVAVQGADGDATDQSSREAAPHEAEEAEIAADDAGASAHFETPQPRGAQGLENDG